MRRPWALAVAAVALSGSALLSGPAGAATGTSGWSIQPSPNPAGASASTLGAVSCPGDGTCMAVGSYVAGTTSTLAERWDGSTWSIVATPDAARSSTSLLLGVSCAGPTSCMAVGFSIQPQSVIRALTEQWDGTAWSIVPLRLPPDSWYAVLDGVSCPAPNSCTAVGGYIPNGVDSQSRPLAEHWDGTTWTIEPTPTLHAENGSGLSSVSCTGAVACTAVGDYAYADVDQSVFAFRWNGIRWTRRSQPNPGGEYLNTDYAVSCTSASACTSVGTWVDNSGNGRGLAERWDGTSWVRQAVADPSGASITDLYGVWCAGGSACTAVGEWSATPNGLPSSTLAEGWNGTAWSIQPTPNPASAQLSSLRAVDCTSPTSCVAVGSYWDGHITRTLIESFSG